MFNHSVGKSFIFRDLPFFMGKEPSENKHVWEMSVASLVPKVFDNLFKENNLTIIPVAPGFAYLSMIVDVFSFYEKEGFLKDSVCILDLPKDVSPFIDTWSKSFPENILLGDKASLEKADAGVFTPQGMGDFYYCESLNIQRLIYNLFLKESSQKTKVVSLSDEFLKHGLFNQRNGLPWNTLQPSAFIPWLEMVFSFPFSINKNMEWVSLAPVISILKKSEGRPVFWFVGADVLSSLDSFLSHNEQSFTEDIQEEGLYSLGDKRSSKKWTIRRISDASAADISYFPGFYVRNFYEKGLEEPREWKYIWGRSWFDAIQRSKKRYEEWTHFDTSRAKVKNYFRFANRLASLNQEVTPSNFDLVLAAQAAIDSNFSFELEKEVRDYPHQEDLQSIPLIDLPLSAILPNVEVLSIAQFQTLQSRRSKKPKLRNINKSKNKISFHDFPDVSEDKYKDNSWVYEDTPFICSFPEEDIFMEDFAYQYRDQAKEMIKAKETVSKELEVSIKDGLDIRETVRNWHRDIIMVKEEMNIGKADIGSVIFQFAEQDEEDSFKWLSYWLAEEHDKTDLMFYASPYQQEVIGPGVARSQFGGFAAIPLPNYLHNPWFDPFIRHFSKTFLDALLISGALATDHKSILHIGVNSPSTYVKELLKRSGKNIIFMHLDELPSDKLRRLRTFHILAEHGVRSYADKYIRKDWISTSYSCQEHGVRSYPDKYIRKDWVS